MENHEFIFDVVKVTLLVLAALFSYWKFLFERPYHERIEFNLTMNNLGIIKEKRIIEILVVAENKGYKEHKIKHIYLKVRGIDSKHEIKELTNHEPRLAFPIPLHSANLISNRVKHYFIRPNVKQLFPITLSIPKEIDLIVANVKFNYKSGSFHISEKTVSFLK